MFVSSYSTYINTNNTDRIAKERETSAKIPSETFKSKLSQTSVLESKDTKNLPISYISNYKSFSNKQKLEQDLQNQDTVKYTKANAQISAKSAYSENSKMFSFLLKPAVTLDQTPKVDKKLPQNIQDIKEQDTRKSMINAYTSNDKYFQITAA